jgi:hypothetical protein
MKILKKQIRIVSLLFVIAMILQSCTAYKITSVSLDHAAKTEKKVKLKTKSNNTLKFEKVDFEDGKYYGIKKVNRDVVKIPIEESNLSSIQVKDRTSSTILTILAAIPGAILISGIIAAATW